ncbi:hypothetical protein BASA83_002467 [Batrachochytrium salamandrivorans]|nr:hypothetical protein BASA83_002467 [Batrachochytrium salamandrivorans]
MVWELYTNEKDAHMKIACICQHCGNQIVHRKKSERTVFAFAEMQSFSEGNDVIRPNQSTGLVQQCQGKQEKDNWSSFKRRNITKLQPKQALFFSTPCQN